MTTDIHFLHSLYSIVNLTTEKPWHLREPEVLSFLLFSATSPCSPELAGQPPSPSSVSEDTSMKTDNLLAPRTPAFPVPNDAAGTGDVTRHPSLQKRKISNLTTVTNTTKSGVPGPWIPFAHVGA